MQGRAFVSKMECLLPVWNKIVSALMAVEQFPGLRKIRDPTYSDISISFNQDIIRDPFFSSLKPLIRIEKQWFRYEFHGLFSLDSADGRRGDDYTSL